MSLMTDLATYVETQSGITDLIGTRFYPQIAKSADLPYVIYLRAEQQRQPHSGGSSGLVTTTMRITCFADTYNEAQDIADKFRLELDGFQRDDWGSTTIHQCRLEAESDGLEPLHFGQNDAPHFVSQDYQITHKETVPSH